MRVIFDLKRGCSETCREIKRETSVLRLFFVLKVGKLNVPFYEKYRCSRRKCSVKKVFLKVLQNSWEATCVSVCF